MAKEDEFDMFHNHVVYEKAEQIFITELPKIESIKDDCIFILDTNALLLPFSTSSESLDEIRKILSELKEKKQLIIPDQVAREFANNRPKKIGELFQNLNKKRNGINDLKIGSYPLLENIDGYQEVIEIETQIKDILKTYRNAIGKLVDTVKSWSWDDPVSLLYRQLLTPDIIYTLQFKKVEIQDQLRYRYKHKIPPGYKDGNKEDEGIGDFLIWLSVLAIAQEKQKSIIFVSGDEKTDWYHRSDNVALYPRFELLAEFKTKCSDGSFHIIKLSDLLKLKGAKEEIITEIKIEEEIESEIEKKRFGTPSYLIAERAVYFYYKERYVNVYLPSKSSGDCDFYYINNDREVIVNVILLTGSTITAKRKAKDRINRLLHYNRSNLNNPQEIVFVFESDEIDTTEILNQIHYQFGINSNLLVNEIKIQAGMLDESNNFFPIG